VNVIGFTVWTLAYTLPRWDEAVVQPIYDSREPSVEWAVAGYFLFAVLVAIHAVSFWKSVYRLGTVPTAVSKGAQQSGVFLFAHILFCHRDPTECLWNNSKATEHTLWSQWQKSAALGEYGMWSSALCMLPRFAFPPHHQLTPAGLLSHMHAVCCAGGVMVFSLAKAKKQSPTNRATVPSAERAEELEQPP